MEVMVSKVLGAEWGKRLEKNTGRKIQPKIKFSRKENKERNRKRPGNPPAKKTLWKTEKKNFKKRRGKPPVKAALAKQRRNKPESNGKQGAMTSVKVEAVLAAKLSRMGEGSEQNMGKRTF